MDLFSTAIDINQNLLPYGGTVNYYRKLFTLSEADHYFDALMNTIEWKK
jgi:hypothetical protein